MDDAERFSLLGSACVWTCTVPPNDRMAYDDRQWRRALVVVEQGVLEVVCGTGERRVFTEGAVLYFDGLGLRWLVNPGVRPLLLTALSLRRR